ncbi:MAG: septum formation initiator family protein [Halothiobacillus sp.]
MLALLLAGLQWRLWYSDSSIHEVWNKQARLADLVATQESLVERNRRLYAEVDDLKTGLGAVEARARLDLGLIGPNETFYQVIEDARPEQITPNPIPAAPNANSAVPQAKTAMNTPTSNAFPSADPTGSSLARTQ